MNATIRATLLDRMNLPCGGREVGGGKEIKGVKGSGREREGGPWGGKPRLRD